MKRTTRRLAVTASALVLALPACSTGATGGDTGGSDSGTVTVAPGTTVNLDDCGASWSNTAGISDGEIHLGISAPRSGALASVGEIADGMKAYFDYVNKTNPVAGKQIKLDIRDDGYDPARTSTNVTEMLSANDTFAFTYIVGTANNRAVRPMLEDACTPQIAIGSGSPEFSDPAKHPWGAGGLLAYPNEALVWCNYLADHVGKRPTVAGLFMDNDYGDGYLAGMEQCAKSGKVDLTSKVRHEPSAPTITNQVTTMRASKADVAILGTTSAFCAEGLASIVGSSWRPLTIVSSTCASIGVTFAPIDPNGAGTKVALVRKDVHDAQYANDKAVQETARILTAAGLDPASDAFHGVALARYDEYVLRTAAKMDGGLNRVNVLKAIWHSDFADPLYIDGIVWKTDGVNDPYLLEAAQVASYVPPTGTEPAHFQYDGDLTTVKAPR